MSGYEPGYCNIGRRQRRRRSLLAGAGFGVAVLYVLAYVGDLLPSPLLVGVFVPLAFGFEWGIQAYSSFCVRLALFGRYDFRGQADDTAGTVSDPEARRADRVHAAKITCGALGLAAVTTVMTVVVLP